MEKIHMPRKKNKVGRPKGSKNKRNRRVRTSGMTVIPANGAPTSGDNTTGDPVLAGFAVQKSALQTKLDKLVAAEKSYIESLGGNPGVSAMSIPADLLLTRAGTIDQRSDRAKAFLAEHPEMKGVVIQH
jgi:hypothetical protein